MWRHEKSWLRLQIMGWCILALLIGSGNLLPATTWFEVRRVAVQDTIVGASPRMYVDRIIRRPFRSRWFVEIERKAGDRYVLWCHNNGVSNYEIDNDLPEPLTLLWWLEAECKLPPGVYRVDTFWRWEVFGGFERSIRQISNDFKVSAP